MKGYLPLDLEPEQMAALTAVGTSFALLRRAAERQLASQGTMTRVQFEILGHLSGSPEGLRMFEIADRVVLSRSTLTYHIGQLEDMGLVSRDGGTSTQRAVVARITDAGEEVMHERRSAYTALIRTHFVDNFTQEELTVVAAGFERVIDSLRHAEASSAPSPERP